MLLERGLLINLDNFGENFYRAKSSFACVGDGAANSVSMW